MKNQEHLSETFTKQNCTTKEHFYQLPAGWIIGPFGPCIETGADCDWKNNTSDGSCCSGRCYPDKGDNCGTDAECNKAGQKCRSASWSPS